MLSFIRKLLHSASGADQMQLWWDARVQALESILGKCDGTVYHSPPPMHLSGYADVLRFRNHIAGITYVTCDLIGNSRQVPNNWGNYELMMCTRDEDAWAPAMLSRLAKYTHESALHLGDTMDLGHAAPVESSVSALLFTLPDMENWAFEVLGKPASLLLCLGITAEEFTACKVRNSGVMLRMLKEQGIFPYTDLHRGSVVGAIE